MPFYFFLPIDFYNTSLVHFASHVSSVPFLVPTFFSQIKISLKSGFSVMQILKKAQTFMWKAGGSRGGKLIYIKCGLKVYSNGHFKLFHCYISYLNILKAQNTFVTRFSVKKPLSIFQRKKRLNQLDWRFFFTATPVLVLTPLFCGGIKKAEVATTAFFCQWETLKWVYYAALLFIFPIALCLIKTKVTSGPQKSIDPHKGCPGLILQPLQSRLDG